MMRELLQAQIRMMELLIRALEQGWIELKEEENKCPYCLE